MNTSIFEPRKTLNKAFLRIKPNRSGIESFKQHLVQLLDRCNEKESEEFHKNLISDFLKKTYYEPDHFINTKGRNDLVVHNGKDAKSSVGVIIETKSPSNKSEMISRSKLNCKALQESVLYFLRERITHKNLEIRHIIITNIYEWFVFDAQIFNKLFADNKELVKQFEDFEQKRLAGNKTDFFYKQIVEPFIDKLPATLEYTHFDLRDYKQAAANLNRDDDRKLIALYKLFSPEHLLKLSFANDSNTLDKNFYAELLHIIGLTEVKEGGKKIIERNKPGQRNTASLIENAILQLESMDKLSRLKNPKVYGTDNSERLFNVALELTISWVNRILFLKLLEAQLFTYHKKDKAYAFLNSDKIRDYDGLNSLFFQVLAKRSGERTEAVNAIFGKVPYLNSSLFEMTDLEHDMFPISQLEDHKTLPLLNGTVIKDVNGKKKTGEMDALAYFFAFLDAYDFASEGTEDIQEDNKTLINASVLGLLFEKINGYKDGSVFTPGFITMYMCRETIRRAVIQKFNEAKGWNCENFTDLQNQSFSISEANKIINSLRLCDPAVGSGHFLVSALNEIISLKSKLQVLCDKEGVLLKHYDVIIENDELMVFDNRDGSFFQYNPHSAESQRVQETLFTEKQTIIENCLFGVDINPNSVKICRLRLWIELLKNAYYKSPGMTELETLPNIDINIKNGNSLVSRFPLDADLSKALKSSKWNIDSYKLAVATYRDAQSKEQKRDMEQLIADIKGNFRSEISSKDPKKIKLEKQRGELLTLTTQTNLFGRSKKEETDWNKKVKTITLEIGKLESEIEEIKGNKIYENAFEWRFEFPEVLDDDGKFVGFDAVIGNPPYIQLQKMGQVSIDLERMQFETYAKTGDIYSLFYELGFNILKPNGLLTFITSNKWMRAGYGESLRKYFAEKTNPVLLIDFGGIQVFDSATVDTNILIAEKAKNKGETYACVLDKTFSIKEMSDFVSLSASVTTFKKSESWIVLSGIEQQIKSKIEAVGTRLKDWNINIYRGVLTGYNEAFIIDKQKRDELIMDDPKSAEIIRPILRGKDIKRYKYDFADSWLINIHNGIREKNVKPISINDYPAVKEHLDKFKDQLERRLDQGVTMYNLRNCAYTEDFLKPKIVWAELARSGNAFTIDREGFHVSNTGYILVMDDDLEKQIGYNYLLAFLNSKAILFYLDTIATRLDKTGWRWLRQFVELLPIPIVKDFNQSVIDNVSREINKTQSESSQKEIEDFVNDAYSFTSEEIDFIRKL